MPRLVALPLALLLLSVATLAQEPPRPDQGQERELRSPRGREIRTLVEALGSREFQAREAARARLLEIGPEALPWLERAQDDVDPERAGAAAELVRTLRWLVPADLRGLVQDRLDDFPGKPAPRRRDLVLGLAQLGQLAGPALPWLVAVARFDPDPEVRLVAAEVFLALTRGTRSEHDRPVLTALAEEQETPRLLLVRGVLLRRLGQLEPAIAAARRCAELAPGAREPRALLVELLVDARRYDEALPLAEADLTLSGDDPPARVRLGELLLLSGRVEEGLAALAPLEKAAVEGKELDLLLRLVRAYLRGQRPDEGEKLLRVALGRFPYDHDLNVALGDVHRQRGRARQALDVWLGELALTQVGGGPYQELCRRLGELLVAEGARPELAQDEAFFRDAHRGRPLVDVHLAVGSWLRARGLLDDAARELRLACALAPGQGGPRRLLGEVLAEAGRYEEARQALRQALEREPKDVRAKARLAELEGAVEAPAAASGGERCAFWERQLEPGELERAPEAVPGEAAPPLVVGATVLAPAAGTTRIYGLGRKDGRTLWQWDATPPPPPEGALPEQMGLEPVALLSVPAGLVAATHPARARSRTPLAAYVCNVYWRPAHRTWRKAAWKGVRAWVLDPETGQELLARDVPLDAQVVAPRPVARRGRALVCVSGKPGRLELVHLDLLQLRPLWRSRVPAGLGRPPRFDAERVVLAWRDGALALGEGGKLLWEHTLAPAAEGGEEPGPAQFTTGPGVGPGLLAVGTGDGRLVALDPASGQARELARPGQGRLTGEVVVEGERVYVAERGGSVHALRLADGATVWRSEGARVAERELAWAGGLLFGLNGAGDVFEGEVPAVHALDPADGRVVFQRPVGRPATLVTGEGLVAVVSGGRGTRAGLQVVAVLPTERFDALRGRLEELRSAAQAALAEGQAEVAAVVARAWVAQLGGLERLDREGLQFLARALARSNRPDEALDAVYLGEARAQKGEQASWDALRKELNLEAPAEEPKKPEEPKQSEEPKKPEEPQQPDAPQEPKAPKPLPPRPPEGGG